MNAGPDSSSSAVPYRLGGLHFPELQVPSVKRPIRASLTLVRRVT